VKNTTETANQKLTRLSAFRQETYDCLTRSGDALFELVDALILSPQLQSFPDLSSVPIFRRCWPSLYECLEDGRIDEKELLRLYLQALPESERPVLVGDHTAWPRLYTQTLEDVSIQHQPTPIALQVPITIGYGFSTLGVAPEHKGSWFLPLLHERIESQLTPSEKAAKQLETIVPSLAQRPLALYDSEYGSGKFFQRTAQVECDLLVRIKSHRTLYRPAPPYRGKGRPPKHGPCFRFKDRQTWDQPDQQFECDDERLGRIRVQCWRGLHFKDAAECPFDLLRIERLSARDTKRDPKVVWLARRFKDHQPLDQCWEQYLRRYSIEHWYRFIKQKLHWKLPAVSTPAQSQLWSWLIVLASWFIFLAREVVKDQPKPWQKAQTTLTPGRVMQSIGPLLARIGTPASAPKPRGKSPGWQKGRPRNKRTTYPLVKKHPKKVKKRPKKPAPKISETG
jgi:hypothetical protein